MVQVLTNHVGYDGAYTKKAVFVTKKGDKANWFTVNRYTDDAEVYRGKLIEAGEVAKWNLGYYFTMRFDEVTQKGKYYITVSAESGEYKSFPFGIDENLLELKTLSHAAYYFKAQRPTSEFDAADSNLRFRGSREGSRDVRGGWYDATGDYGIHMSQQSHANYFNPQQAAFSAYSFFRFHDMLEASGYPYYTMLKRRMLDEGMYGADFVMRMRAPSGSFFRSKGRDTDAFEPVHKSRCISCSLHSAEAAQGELHADDYEVADEDYETAFRSGAGYCIATLAYAARTNFPGADYSAEEYLQAALDSYQYLSCNNTRYCPDGKENLTDDYCRLDAVIEIYKTTRIYGYLREAQAVVRRIIDRYVADGEDMGYFSVDGTDRPFFNAADEGMPVVNLIHYYEIETDKTLKAEALNIAEKVMRHHLKVTNSQTNPFGYAGIFCIDGKGNKKEQFFYPHDVETAPWWQGDNARIGSLSSAARMTAELTADTALKAALTEYADDQINWILGLNPYDSCMMEGVGRNTNAYFYECRNDFIHCPGGIVNGITGGLHDDKDGIDFIFEPTDEIKDNWRWAEQWIPHCTWYMHALTSKKI